MASILAPPWALGVRASWKLILFTVGMFTWIYWIIGQLNMAVPCCAGPQPRLGRAWPKDRPLITYAYAESDIARANLEFFVEKGIHRRADFVFIFNGPTNATELVPRLPNVWQVRRNNTCFDIGAIGEVLRIDNMWKRYKWFITMNASVRGPFLPVYSSACWSDLFLQRITHKTKLIGITMNCMPRPHVQSMVWATDRIGMSLLQDPFMATKSGHEDIYGTASDPVGMSACYHSWDKAVHAEIGTTELMRSRGYGVDVLMTSFHGLPATHAYCDVNIGSPDPFFNDKYFGSNIHPYETVFFKANRDVDPLMLQHMTIWHKQREFRAWDACGPGI